MSDCCTATKDLGCKYSCDLIQTGLTAAQTGVFVLEKTDGTKIVSNTVTIGQPITFSGGYLNEDAVTVFKVVDPDGNYLETADGEDCFEIDIKPSSDPTLADVEVDCPEPDCATCETTVDIYLDSVLQSSNNVTCGGTETINVLWL